MSSTLRGLKAWVVRCVSVVSTEALGERNRDSFHVLTTWLNHWSRLRIAVLRLKSGKESCTTAGALQVPLEPYALFYTLNIAVQRKLTDFANTGVAKVCELVSKGSGFESDNALE